MLQKLVTCLSLSLLLLTSALPIPAITSTPQAEAISAAMWTHGTSVQVENPGVVKVTRYGFYTRVDGNSGAATWFHFAIPTTVILSDVRKQVDSVMLQFESLGATVTNVHIYDGPAKIAVYDSMNLEGHQNFPSSTCQGIPSSSRASVFQCECNSARAHLGISSSSRQGQTFYSAPTAPERAGAREQ